MTAVRDEPAPERLGEDPDAALLAGLRAGDEAAFAALVDRYAASMLHVARMHVPSRAVAEEVVQETWLAVLEGLPRFEGRSSLRTWLFRILTNRAKTRGARERRTVPFAALAERETSEAFTAVDPERFLPADHERWPHHWAAPPRRWDEDPERALDVRALDRLVRDAIRALPPVQRLVVTMRDVEGWSAEEVCEVLDLTQVNQRVLLHRGRSRVRQAVEEAIAP